MHKQEYVNGFLFFKRDGFDKVLLILKNRPKWQAGCFNGIGGKVEPGELHIDAMRREFWEEAGVETNILWREFGVVEGVDYRVFYYTRELDAPPEWVSKTDEVIFEFFASEIPDNITSPSKQMLQLARSSEYYTKIVVDKTDQAKL